MKNLLISCLLIACNLSVVAQLKVANNYGKDLNVTINGQTTLVNNKSVGSFNVRAKKVQLDCSDPASKIKFSITKEVSRSGYTTIEISDYQAPASAPVMQMVTQYETQSTTPVYSNSSTSGTTLNNILNGGSSNANYPNQSVSYEPAPVTAQKNYTQSVIQTQVQPNYPAQVQTQVQPNYPAQVQTHQQGFEKIRVVYNGAERFKVFSDIGGGRWQGIEFRGTQDSIKDNARNSYYLYAQKDQDIHIGVVFKPEDAINEYGEFRKRLNREDSVLYINQRDIQKMSTDKKKQISIRLMAKDFKIYFQPKIVDKENNDPISLKYHQESRRFLAPIGQFYLKISCTDAKGMFHPTVFIPVHVATGDDYVEIGTNDLNRAINSDINLNWSTLNYQSK